MLSPRPDLDPDQLFSAFDFADRSTVIAAVSGGSDSLAMLLLLKGWLGSKMPATRPMAVTVDHQLRKGSALEAEKVAAFCAARGIAHETLQWLGGKPFSGISASAREARYNLLAHSARRTASDIIVTGHTADDQAETVAMRQARGGGRGLAGMAQATLFDGRCWIIRPFLATSRADLRDWLLAEKVQWIDDPTNEDDRFERVRVRSVLKQTVGAREALLTAARNAASLRSHLSQRAAALVDRYVSMPSPGVAHVRQDFTEENDRDAMIYGVRTLLAVIGGSQQLPDEKRVAGLLESETGRATLSRTVVDRRKAGMFVYREARGLPPPCPTMDGMVWDERFRFTGGQGSSFVVSAGATHAVEAGVSVPDSIRAAGLAALPRLVTSSGKPVASRAGQFTPMLAPWTRFLPSFDLDLAVSLARLVDAPEIPAPPLASHNRREG